MARLYETADLVHRRVEEIMDTGHMMFVDLSSINLSADEVTLHVSILGQLPSGHGFVAMVS